RGEKRGQRIAFFLETLQHSADGELLGIELCVHLAPFEGGRDWRDGKRPHAERGDHELPVPILQEVQVDLAFSGGDGPCGGGDVTVLALDHARQEMPEGSRLVISKLPRQRNEHVQSRGAAGLYE